MQRALERSNPHRRHIAELSSGINIDYVNKLKKNEPIHFGGLKKELITRYEGGAIVKPMNYQGDVIRAFGNKNGMPKPDMHFTPDTLATGKPIRFNLSMPMTKSSEYQTEQDIINNDYDIIKDMPMNELNKYLKNKQGVKLRAEADRHKGVQQKRIKRRVKAIEANEPENENIDYGLSNLYGQGLKKRLLKKAIRKVIKKIK